MKLLAFAQQLAEATEAAVSLEGAHCLHSWDRYSECEACVQICPVGAIEAGKPPSLDPEKCEDCRACLASCPTGACFYSGIDAGDALQESIQYSGLKVFELLCDHNARTSSGFPGTEAAIKVRGCLAGIGAGAYLALAGMGVEQVVLRTDACLECPWQKIAQHVISQVEAAQRLLALWGREGMLKVVDSQEGMEQSERPWWRAESPPRSRRSLFRFKRDETEKEDAPALNEERPLFQERRRFLRALKQMAPPTVEVEGALSLAGLGFARLTVSEACTACGTCARACPTKAITFEDEESSFRLHFSARICVGCGICDHVCGPKAIEIDQAPPFDQVFGPDGDDVLQEGSLVKCGRCKAPFAAHHGNRLCPVCTFRRENPFGSAMPPGLRVNVSRIRKNDLSRHSILED